MRDNVFLDTNVLIYSLSKDIPFKKRISRNLLKEKYFISVQVVFEFINVSVRKLGHTRKESIKNAEALIKNSEFVFEDNKTVELALQILKKYKLQIFDSKIVASALLSGCSILYSEDMQHGQVFEHKLKIVNPFL